MLCVSPEAKTNFYTIPVIMRKLQVLSFLVLFSITGTIQAQQLNNQMDASDQKVPQEKRHLHFDKNHTPRTFYRKPNLTTDNTGKKIKFSFYNNDIGHSMRVVIEGLAQDGRMIHINKLLK